MPEASDPRPRARRGSPPLALSSAEPRIFGLVPAVLALGLGLAAIALGIALVAVGRPPDGLAAIGAGALLAALALDSARRWPTSPLARGLVAAADAVGARLGLAGVFAGAWWQAVREVIRLRAELRALREERDREQFELGGAAARADEEEIEERRGRMEEVERRIEEAEGALTVTIESARARVDRERVSIKPTQPIAIEEVDPSSRKTTATEPRRRRA